MKTASLLLNAHLLCLVSASYVVSVPATLTKDVAESALAAPVTLERRVDDTQTTEPPVAPKLWIRVRTLPTTTVTELVTPTIWGGVTFSASPRSHSKTPLPWLSLDREGKVKTISPQLKNGITQNGSPHYGTWFDEIVTETINLKTAIEGVSDDTIHEQEKHIVEDTTDRELNPIIRCTPERYFNKKRRGRKLKSEPFCTPREGSRLLLDSTYWISWYTKSFPDADKVRLHLAYIELNKYGKIGKRDFIPDQDSGLAKRDTDNAFWSSDWLPNLDGVYPLTITDDMFQDMPVQNIMLTVQPDYIMDDEFNLVNGTYMQIFRRPIKGSGRSAAKIRTEDEGSSDSLLYIAMTIPTILVVFFVFFMVFNFCVRNNRSWKSVRVKSRRTSKLFGKKNKYSKLPSNSYELDRFN